MKTNTLEWSHDVPSECGDYLYIVMMACNCCVDFSGTVECDHAGNIMWPKDTLEVLVKNPKMAYWAKIELPNNE